MTPDQDTLTARPTAEELAELIRRLRQNSAPAIFEAATRAADLLELEAEAAGGDPHEEPDYHERHQVAEMAENSGGDRIDNARGTDVTRESGVAGRAALSYGN